MGARLMAQLAVRSATALAPGWVLAPERYDPRLAAGGPGTPLGALAEIVREHVTPARATGGPYLVLDTGDAQEGVLLPPAGRVPVPGSALGSAKKVARPGDVLISRLRPYLRQVALVDGGLTGATIACSSEFHVLRGRDGRSVAFLVAFLLSAPAQEVLAAAVEGGHHPRFRQEALEALVVPDAVLEARDELSAQVERAVAQARAARQAVAAAVARALPALP